MHRAAPNASYQSRQYGWVDAGRSMRLRLVREGVEALAMEVADQTRLVGTGHVDELGLAFDEGLRGVAPSA